MKDNELIKLVLSQPIDPRLKAVPIVGGLPLPKGWFGKDDMFTLYGHDSELGNIQHRTLASWSDGSAKWVLVNFFVQPTSHKLYNLYIKKEKNSTRTKERVKGITIITASDESVHVNNGKCDYWIDSSSSKIFRSIKINGRELLNSELEQLLFHDAKKKKKKIRLFPFVVEDHGPITSTLKGNGLISGGNNKQCINLTIRIQFFWSQTAVKMDVTIHNPNSARHPGGIWDLGDSGSVFFKDFGFVFPCADSIEKITYSEHSEKNAVTIEAKGWRIHQNSSGGENWDSLNHIDCNGSLSVDFKGYQVATGASEDQNVIAQGERATPFVQLIGKETWVAVGVYQFWQNFPKAIKLIDNLARIDLFPDQEQHLFELQGGEKKRHTIYIDFGSNSDKESIIQDYILPAQAVAAPEWITSTGAISGFIGQNEDPNKDYLSYIQNALDGTTSFFAKRELIDEFGWRNFGDVYADHEAAFKKSNNPLISHYNNQYDLVYGTIVQFLRSGDERWWQLASDYARHVIDIDIYHTEKDKPGYNHGLFWHTDHYRDAGTCSHRSFTSKNLDPKKRRTYGGGPSNENNYTTGLLHFYFLTGDRDAYEAVLELAGWVVDMDDGQKTIFNFIDDGPTGLASQTVSTDFHKPGRGSGNSINALVDAYQLTGSRHFFSKTEELITRCIHPSDDIDSLKLGEPEYRWSYLVFLQGLTKYLDRKVELKEIDYSFFYARDSLLHYADWMVANEVPYNDVLDKVEIPTETWPAQDVRKCCVLHYASKYAIPERREAYAKKAAFFFTRCLEDLCSYDTAFFTRPMALLISYGYYHAYFQSRQPSINFEKHSHDFGSPKRFKHQRARIKHSMSNKAAVITGFVVRGILSTVDRLRRRYRTRRKR